MKGKENASLDARWGIILAGGEGSRLRAVTELIGGRDCPKQFCRLLGEKTLYEQTEERASLLLSPDRLIPVTTRSQASFYPRRLSSRPSDRIVIQPKNRGTAAAIAYGLLRVQALDRGAEVAIFPCDHWVSDDARFMGYVAAGFEALRSAGNQVVLLGAEATAPETQYGWIEPGSQSGGVVGMALPVGRFWEKPSRAEATRLWRRGCLWNTFVMIARASRLLDIIAQECPLLVREFSELGESVGNELEGLVAENTYRRLQDTDFSARVLRTTKAPLGVIPVHGVKWSDLGDPVRLGALTKAIREDPSIGNGASKSERSIALSDSGLMEFCVQEVTARR